MLALLLFLGQRLMRGWFHLVARQKSAELFVLNVLLITLGLAYVTEIAGLSLALGAFVAGALISETEYRHQVEVDIKPFRDILLGLFFVTIGMLLDWRVVIDARRVGRGCCSCCCSRQGGAHLRARACCSARRTAVALRGGPRARGVRRVRLRAARARGRRSAC